MKIPQRIHNCPICGESRLTTFFEHRGVPTQDGVIWNTREEALNSPVGDIVLALCPTCGAIPNLAYDPDLVHFLNYNVSTDHSLSFRDFLSSLAERLISSYSLNERLSLDIGCGTGAFLRELCRQGNNRGVGVDPSWSGYPTSPEGKGITFIRDYYSVKYAAEIYDLVSCRQLVDLIGDPLGFTRLIRESIGTRSDTTFYCEVPRAQHTIANNIVWNVVYERHVWFTEQSFQYMIESAGFRVLRSSPCWHDEYLGIDARPVENAPVPSRISPGRFEALANMVRAFTASTDEIRGTWRDKLERLRAEGKRVAIWGAGARGIMFLADVQRSSYIGAVVDINPARQGKFLPRSAQRVEPPSFLRTFRPDVLIISNPTYADEIQGEALGMGIAPLFLEL